MAAKLAIGNVCRRMANSQFRVSGRRFASSESNPSKALNVSEEYLFRSSQEKARSTLDSHEVDKFRRMSKSWWDPQGQCKPLHSMNTLRISLIHQGLTHTGKICTAESPQPLKGVEIMDVGCGGGILSENLARLGAQVTALDAGQENIDIAKEHGIQDETIRSRISYVCSTVEDFASANPHKKFDAVVASEVLEHVNHQDLFVKTCSSLLSANGSLFITTINRNRSSYLMGVVAAENLLGLLPVGTHDWDKFVTPEELNEMITDAGCQTRLIHGMFYWPLSNQWTWIPQATINYALHAIKCN